MMTGNAPSIFCREGRSCARQEIFESVQRGEKALMLRRSSEWRNDDLDAGFDMRYRDLTGIASDLLTASRARALKFHFALIE